MVDQKFGFQNLELVENYNNILREGYNKNKDLIFSHDLFNGWEIVRHRTSLVDRVLKDFFEKLSGEQKTKGRILLGAVGGYGRKELTPNSDVDAILLVEDLSSDEQIARFYEHELNCLFEKLEGISSTMIVNSPEDISNSSYFDEKKFTSFLDLRKIAGSSEIGTLIREKLIEHKERMIPNFALNKASDMQSRHKDKFPQDIWNVGLFNIKEGIGALRDFHEAIWFKAIENYDSSEQVYKSVSREVLNSVSLLLKARSWLGVTRKIERAGVKVNDNFKHEDFINFEDYFGEEGLACLIEARKTIKQFGERVINERLSKGIKVSKGIEYTREGLGVSDDGILMDKETLFYRTMLLSQTNNIPISPKVYNTFLDTARDCVAPNRTFLDFFSSDGNLSKTLERLSEMRMLCKLIPGFSSLETSLYRGEHRSSQLTREGRAIERIKSLETLVRSAEENLSESEKLFFNEYGKLDRNELRNLRLALLVKEIPQTMKVNACDYIRDLSKLYSLDEQTIGEVSFLINNKRLMLDTVTCQLVDDPRTIVEFSDKVRDENLLRSLLLFSYCDLDYRKENKFSIEQWKNICLLYKNSMDKIMGRQRNIYSPEYYDEEGNKIVKSLPKRFFESIYAQDKMNFNSYIRRLREVDRDKKPIVEYRTKEGNGASYVIVSGDFSGLLWRVAGTFFKNGMNIGQAQIYSTSGSNPLALDFFDVNYSSEKIDKKLADVRTDILETIINRTDIDGDPVEILKSAVSNGVSSDSLYKLETCPDRGYLRLSIKANDVPGTLYATSKLLSTQAEANILSINKSAHKDGSITRNFFFYTKRDLNYVNSIFSSIFC